MKPMQAVKGYQLPQNTTVDILEEYGAPIIMVQNTGSGRANLILNDGEPLQMTGAPFGWEPLVPICGTIRTDSADLIVFA